jgi:hypothetical protein
MEVLKPLSSPRTPASLRRSEKPATATAPWPPRRALLGLSLGLFLSGQPPWGMAAMALPTVEVETASPKCSSKASRCSSRVRSSFASRCFGSHSLSIAPFLAGLPGIGSGSTSPLSRRLLSQRFMVGTDTEKVLATSSLGLPESTAARTLNLRSFEYGFMPGGYHTWVDTYGSRCQNAVGAKFAEFPFQRLSGNSYARASRLAMSLVIAA